MSLELLLAPVTEYNTVSKPHSLKDPRFIQEQFYSPNEDATLVKPKKYNPVARVINRLPVYQSVFKPKRTTDTNAFRTAFREQFALKQEAPTFIGWSEEDKIQWVIKATTRQLEAVRPENYFGVRIQKLPKPINKNGVSIPYIAYDLDYREKIYIKILATNGVFMPEPSIEKEQLDLETLKQVWLNVSIYKPIQRNRLFNNIYLMPKETATNLLTNVENNNIISTEEQMRQFINKFFTPPAGTSAGTSAGTPPGTPPGTSAGTPAEPPEETSKETSKEPPEETSKETSKETPEEISVELLEETSEETSEETPEEIIPEPPAIKTRVDKETLIGVNGHPVKHTLKIYKETAPQGREPYVKAAVNDVFDYIKSIINKLPKDTKTLQDYNTALWTRYTRVRKEFPNSIKNMKTKSHVNKYGFESLIKSFINRVFSGINNYYELDFNIPNTLMEYYKTNIEPILKEHYTGFEKSIDEYITRVKK